MRIQTTNFPQSKHDTAQEKVLSHLFFDLCLAAGSEHQQEKAEADSEVKAEFPALARATHFINTLDARIASMQDLFQLNKKNILNGLILPEKGVDLPTKALHVVITFKLNTLFDLLVQCSEQEYDNTSIVIAAATLNYVAFKFLHEQCKEVDSAGLLMLVLKAKVSNARDEQTQSDIIRDLLPFISPEKLDDLLILAAKELHSPNIVAVLLSRIPRPRLAHPSKFNVEALIEALLNQTTVENQVKISQILLLLLSHFTFTAQTLNSTLITALKTCSAIVHPEVISKLKQLGAEVTQGLLLDYALEEMLAKVASFGEEKLNQRLNQILLQVDALHAAGAHLNHTPKRGINNLCNAVNSGKFILVEKLLSLSYFFPEQVQAVLRACRLSWGPDRVKIVKALVDLDGCVYSTSASASEYSILIFLLHMAAERGGDAEEIMPICQSIINNATWHQLNNVLESFMKLPAYVTNTTVFAKVIEALVVAGVPFNQFNPWQGYTLLGLLVKNNSALSLSYICQVMRLQIPNEIDRFRAAYFTYPEIKPGALRLGDMNLGIGVNNYTTLSRDMYILANGNINIINILLSENYPIKESLAIYKELSVNNPAYKDIYDKLRNHTRPKHYPVASVAINDKFQSVKNINESKEDKDVEMQSLSVSTYNAIDYADSLSTFDLHTMKRSKLIDLINDLLTAESKNQPICFDKTVLFLEKLRQHRFDYISLLTNGKNFPLLHVLKIAKPATPDVTITAITILLAYAPYTQLKRFEEQDEFALGNLHKAVQKVIKQRLDKKDADLPDFAFYLRTRTEKNEMLFYNRVLTFSKLLVLLRANTVGLIEAIDQVIGDTKILFLPGKSTKILNAMKQYTMKQPEPVEITVRSAEYLNRLRFSYMSHLHEPFLLHAESDLQHEADSFKVKNPSEFK